MTTAAEIKAFVVEELDEALRDAGIDPAAVPDDLDLVDAGVIDSLGMIEVITAVEERFGVEIDFEELDPELLTVVGSFARFVEGALAGG